MRRRTWARVITGPTFGITDLGWGDIGLALLLSVFGIILVTHGKSQRRPRPRRRMGGSARRPAHDAARGLRPQASAGGGRRAGRRRPRQLVGHRHLRALRGHPARRLLHGLRRREPLRGAGPGHRRGPGDRQHPRPVRVRPADLPPHQRHPVHPDFAGLPGCRVPPAPAQRDRRGAAGPDDGAPGAAGAQRQPGRRGGSRPHCRRSRPVPARTGARHRRGRSSRAGNRSTTDPNRPRTPSWRFREPVGRR